MTPKKGIKKDINLFLKVSYYLTPKSLKINGFRLFYALKKLFYQIKAYFLLYQKFLSLIKLDY